MTNQSEHGVGFECQNMDNNYEMAKEIMEMGKSRGAARIMEELAKAYQQGYIDGGIYMSSLTTKAMDGAE